MWQITNILPVTSFTFGSYAVDPKRGILTFTYRVTFKGGIHTTFTDRLFLENNDPEAWNRIPASVLTATLQALLLMLGINYWSAFRTRTIHIEGFSLTPEQAEFWNTLYTNGLAEFFYLMRIDFRNLVSFPFDTSLKEPTVNRAPSSGRLLVLNGAGKDSIVSAEMLKSQGVNFDYFAFAPSPAHKRIARLVGVPMLNVRRQRDPLLNLLLAGAYPSVSTFTFIALLLAELHGYDKIIFSNERSADYGNLEYLGLPVNHQWCKSSEAERLIQNYIEKNIVQGITTESLLRTYSELEIVQRFVAYPQYLKEVTSCNTYFYLPRIQQMLMRKNWWCNSCPKCIFLFACFSAFLPKKELLKIFSANLYRKKRHLRLFRRILGIEGFKPLDCVGEPEEMILAMQLAYERGEYNDEPAMKLFREHFPATYNFDTLKAKHLRTNVW